MSTVRAKRPCGRAPNRADRKVAVFRLFDAFIAGVLTRLCAEFAVAGCAGLPVLVWMAGHHNVCTTAIRAIYTEIDEVDR